MAKQQRHVILTIVNTLAVFPQEVRANKRARSIPVEQGVVECPVPTTGHNCRNEHHWMFKDNCWFCCLCLKSSLKLPSKPEPPCEPGNLANNLEKTINKGHHLTIVQPQSNTKSEVSSLPLLWCYKCGKWTQQILRGLADACSPPSGRQGQHLTKLSKGTHPKCNATRLVNGFAVDPSFWSTRWHALAVDRALGSSEAASSSGCCPTNPMRLVEQNAEPVVVRRRLRSKTKVS